MTLVKPRFIPFEFDPVPADQMVPAARVFFETMDRRRSVREFLPEKPPRECIEYAIRAAGTAPSGAHRQPWKFVVVDDPVIKSAIREAAEKEEYESYHNRFPPEWIEALAPLGTDENKPFLEIAPYLVIVFKENYGRGEEGRKITNYYVNESVGIACGMFITALHMMGLVTLTHTPNPMGFLSEILRRPPNEKPFILFPVGYPAEGVTVPDLTRKPLEELMQLNDGT